MRPTLTILPALLLAMTLSACDAPAPPAAPKAPAVPKAPEKAPTDVDAGAAKAPEKAPPTSAPAADKAAPGGGLLPSPDFKLSQPGLKAPESDKKGGNLLGNGAAEKKPTLLDVDLKKGE